MAPLLQRFCQITNFFEILPIVVVFCLKYDIFRQKRENINENNLIIHFKNQVFARLQNLTTIIYDIKGKKREYGILCKPETRFNVLIL